VAAPRKPIDGAVNRFLCSHDPDRERAWGCCRIAVSRPEFDQAKSGIDVAPQPKLKLRFL